MKGGIFISSIGYLQVHAYTSSAQLPLQNVAVVITAEDQTAIAMRLTDRSGLIRTIEIPVPDREESLHPGAEEIPYTRVNLYAHLNGYEQIVSENIQIFSGTTTYQDLEMIPLPEFLPDYDEIIYYETPPQNL